MKKWLALLLVAALMAFAVGASAEEFTDANGNGFTDVGEHVGLAKYDEPVKLTTGMYEAGAIDWQNGDDFTENVWTRGSLDELNIDVDVDWVVSKADYETKLNLMIASDDLPDYFKVDKMSTLMQLIDNGMIQDLDPYYTELATPELINVEEGNDINKACFESARVDGKLYAVSVGSNGYTDKPYYLWISNEWMEQVGAQPPKSMQELKELALKFMDAGLCNYGIAVSSDLDAILNGLALGYHVYPKSWLRADDGSIVYGGIQPEMKEFLKEMNEWYKLGIFKDDFTSRSQDTMWADMAAKECGIGVMIHAYGYWVGQDLVEAFGKESLHWPYAIPSVDEDPVKQMFKWSNEGYICVSSKCENPDAVLKLINFYWAATRTPNEAYQPYRQGGADDIFGAIRLCSATGESDAYYACKEALETGDESVLTQVYWQNKYANICSFENADYSAMGDVVGDRMQMGPNGAYSIGTEIVNNGDYLIDVLASDTPQIYLERGSTLDDILTEGFTKIIVGEKDIDYFDELVNYWLEAGGQTFIDQMNELYA